MIFAGDVAIAVGDKFDCCDFPESLFSRPWCINLEGAISDLGSVPVHGLSNDSRWKASFAKFNLGPVFVGNNHIQDVPGGLVGTLHYLESRGIKAFGAGCNASEAGAPAFVSSDGGRFALLGFGWPVVGCRAATASKPGVNRLEECSALAQLSGVLGEAVGVRVVVVIHGNYEFERYPQPGHRALAMKMIDAGAHAVVFHHAHVVSPIERYKGRTIAYGLGNWMFSHGRFFGGRLRFPKESHDQIALQITEQGDVVHYVRFEPPTTIRYRSSEAVSAQDLRLRAEFEGFSHSEYVKWFRAHRIKKRGLPIYLDAKDSLPNSMRDAWVKGRQLLIDAASVLGLKSLERRAG